MSVETALHQTPVIQLEYGQSITLVAPEIPKPAASHEDIPYPVIRELRTLVRKRGQQMVSSMSGDIDSEYGNTRQEITEINGVVEGLRNAKAWLPQVAHLVYEAVEGSAVPSISDKQMRRDFSNTVTLYLKGHADRVLGEPDPDNYK
ncbi:hypothetical protein BH09PAT1_BH09PAT1_5070 [soil metagenome]